MNPNVMPESKVLHSQAYIGDIVFDAAEPHQLAQFWAGVLGYNVQASSADLVIIADPARQRSRLCFQRSATSKTHKNRVHFDVFVEDRKAEVARIEQSGATVQHTNQQDGVEWTVMLDPEGNEFCVQVAPPGAL
jgi:predicted enzyme related to lactoylglutathione lyase